MLREPPRYTRVRSSAASDVYKRQAGIALCEEKLLSESLLLLQHRHDGILDYAVRFVDLGRVKLDIDSSRIHGRPPFSRASSIRRSFRAGKRARRRSRRADGPEELRQRGKMYMVLYIH